MCHAEAKTRKRCIVRKAVHDEVYLILLLALCNWSAIGGRGAVGSNYVVDTVVNDALPCATFLPFLDFSRSFVFPRQLFGLVVVCNVLDKCHPCGKFTRIVS